MYAKKTRKNRVENFAYCIILVNGRFTFHSEEGTVVPKVCELLNFSARKQINFLVYVVEPMLERNKVCFLLNKF